MQLNEIFFFAGCVCVLLLPSVCLSYQCIPSNILFFFCLLFVLVFVRTIKRIYTERILTYVYLTLQLCYMYIIWLEHGTDRYIRFVIRKRVRCNLYAPICIENANNNNKRRKDIIYKCYGERDAQQQSYLEELLMNRTLSLCLPANKTSETACMI